MTKKIKFYNFCLFFFLSTVTQAQQLYLIPKAGLSVHSLKGLAYQDLKEQKNIGLVGGVAAELGLLADNRLAIQPEILFVRKGSKLVDKKSDPFAQNNEIYKMNYLEIPVLLKTTIGQNRVQLFLNAGPSAGIGLGGKHIFEDADFLGYESKLLFRKPKDRNTSQMQVSPRIDWSIQAGIGVSYDIGPIKLLAESRYGHGLRPLENKTVFANRISSYKEFKNRFLLFNLGASIPLINP